MNKDFMCPICNSAPLITDYCPNCSRIEGHTAPPDAFPQAHRLALELECLLLSCQDNAAVSKWLDSAHEALEQWRQFKAIERAACKRRAARIRNLIDKVKPPPTVAAAPQSAPLTDAELRCEALRCRVKKLMQDSFYAGTVNHNIRAAHWEEDLAKVLNEILERNGEHDWNF